MYYLNLDDMTMCCSVKATACGKGSEDMHATVVVTVDMYSEHA